MLFSRHVHSIWHYIQNSCAFLLKSSSTIRSLWEKPNARHRKGMVFFFFYWGAKIKVYYVLYEVLKETGERNKSTMLLFRSCHINRIEEIDRKCVFWHLAHLPHGAHSSCYVPGHRNCTLVFRRAPSRVVHMLSFVPFVN